MREEPRFFVAQCAPRSQHREPVLLSQRATCAGRCTRCSTCCCSQNLFGKKGKERARFELFGSVPFRGKNLLFRDATQSLQLIDKEAEISHVLGLDYVALLQGLGHEGESMPT